MAISESQSLPILKMPESNVKQRLIKAGALTILVISTTILVDLLQINLKSPQLIEQNSQNFDVYDLIFAGGLYGSDTRDKDIVLVSIDSSRPAIAAQLRRLYLFKPAVIALDVLFKSPLDVEGDKKLTEVISNTNCITATEISEKEDGHLQVAAFFLDHDTTDANTGYLNFYSETEGNWPVIRTFKPFLLQGTHERYSFSARILERYDPKKFQQLHKRKSSKEWINYAGMLEHYEQLSYTDLNEMDSTQLRGKIEGKVVILGYFTPHDQPRVLEDLHYTPLNESIVEKAPPDLYGIGIHANILSMMLKGNYITELSKSLVYLIAIVLIFISWFLGFQIKKWSRLPRILKIIITLLLLFLLVWLCLCQFKYLHIRLPLSPIFLAFFIKETTHQVLSFFVMLSTTTLNGWKITKKFIKLPKPNTE